MTIVEKRKRKGEQLEGEEEKDKTGNDVTKIGRSEELGR